MESSILFCKSIPQNPNHPKQENLVQNPTNPTNSTTLSFNKKPPILNELHLNHLCRNGQLKEAVTALDTICKDGYKVTPKTFISLLQSCIDLNAIEQGRLLHNRIGLVDEVNPFVETKLVSMYAKCGSLKEARRVFEEMTERNLFTWSAIIGGYTREQRWREIIELFYWMMNEWISPDEFLLPKILQACANVGDIVTGKMIHAFVVKRELNSFIPVGNSIVSMYAKCGKLSSARRFFEKMDKKDRVTWNSIISAYCQSGKSAEAAQLFDWMQGEGIEPGLITWNILIAGYNQSGNCDLAIELMKKMESRGIDPDVFTWTSMISGCTQNKRTTQALELFNEMLVAGVEPNGVTIASAVSACASLKALKKGMELHSVGIKLGSMGDVLLGNSLIEMYSKSGNLEAAQNIFGMILEKDVFTWNSMISGYTQTGYFGKAYDLFTRMHESNVKPNVITWNVMISGYIQKGDEDQAMDFFQRMEIDGIIKRNAASWNSLISGLLQNGLKNKAFAVFRKMQSCPTRPNSITLLSILPACSNLVAAKKVKELHGYTFRRRLELDISVANTFMDAYAKSGNMPSARAIFEDLPSRDVISWNTLIAGYVLHGCPYVAMDLFERMRLVGPKPNRGTFASIILAYSLAGMVEQGNNTFSSMNSDYQITPGSDHYSAMLDLLGRSGRLGESVNFIEEMNIEQDSAVWDALFTASRVHGNIGLAVRAVERLFEIEPRNTLVYRLLLQLYTISGKSKDELNLKRPKKRNGEDSSIGCSSIEMKNSVHTVITGDRSLRNSDHIYSQIASVAEEIKIVLPESHETQLNIDEEEKEEICGVHSEKLAISFALISSPYSSQSIRIIKNCRMCRNCHKTAKFISLKYGRKHGEEFQKLPNINLHAVQEEIRKQNRSSVVGVEWDDTRENTKTCDPIIRLGVNDAWRPM
ncbi:Pentatricopeptide repeat-containing protein [Thalictrum thalictroides]|uniref:Pentatricopeptide repeat-containing protein n=1 Tax=Thalictrum thalictroides TaxID=46969 RepID=A0A7J6VBR1_THATH|nr:Pentatricopeptide repeat-containing protein [Thalictrum thalictroides]